MPQYTKTFLEVYYRGFCHAMHILDSSDESSAERAANKLDTESKFKALSIDPAPTRRGIYTGVSGNSDFDTKTCRKAFILYDYHDSISIAVQYFNRVKHSQVIPIHAMYTYVTIYNMEQSDYSALFIKLI